MEQISDLGMNKRIIFPGLYIQRKQKNIKTQSEVNFYMILKIYHESTKRTFNSYGYKIFTQKLIIYQIL